MLRFGHWRQISLSLALAACAHLAIAQDPAPQTGGGATGGGATAGGGAGGGTTGGATPGGAGTGFPGGNTGTGQPGRNTQPFPTDPRETQRSPFPDQMQRPIFLSGKVVLDDGTAPPEQVVIERICNGNPRPEAYTDSKGRFSFQLGQNSHVMADASVGNNDGFGGPGQTNRTPGMGSMGSSGGVSERDLMGCEIRASLPGYRSEVVTLSGRRFMDNPDVGTIILRRMANVEGLTFSATSAMAPKDAKKAYEKSRDLMKKKKIADAQKELEKAVQIYPKFANAWADLGMVHEAQNHNEDARKAYLQALEADAKLVKPYVQMAWMAARENKWQECLDASDRALKLNPFDFPGAYFVNAVANLNLQKFDAAEKSARDGLKSEGGKKIAKMHHVLGIILAQKNDITGAMPHMKNYLGMLPADGQETKMVKDQIAQMEKFASNQPAGEAPAAGQQQQQQQ
ncbi:MAG: tetratricopeptide repeat protein [Bryobacterales bacterium]|nr:tetratricopeptide repeat protein [Bryobacterales bacterium]